MLNAVNLFDSFAGLPNATPAQIADNLSGAFAAPIREMIATQTSQGQIQSIASDVRQLYDNVTSFATEIAGVIDTLNNDPSQPTTAAVRNASDSLVQTVRDVRRAAQEYVTTAREVQDSAGNINEELQQRLSDTESGIIAKLTAVAKAVKNVVQAANKAEAAVKQTTQSVRRSVKRNEEAWQEITIDPAADIQRLMRNVVNNARFMYREYQDTKRAIKQTIAKAKRVIYLVTNPKEAAKWAIQGARDAVRQKVRNGIERLVNSFKPTTTTIRYQVPTVQAPTVRAPQAPRAPTVQAPAVPRFTVNPPTQRRQPRFRIEPRRNETPSQKAERERREDFMSEGYRGA
jgi:phage-related protein